MKWKKQKYSGKKYEQGKVETTYNFKECQGLLNFIKKLQIQRKSPRSLLNIYSTKIITSWEKLLSSSKENNAWGSHIDNGCYQVRLMDGPLNYNKYQRVFRKCFGCKIFQTKQFSTQQNEGILPSGKTTRTRSFQVIGADFAGPIMYRNKKREEKRRKYFFSHAV